MCGDLVDRRAGPGQRKQSDIVAVFEGIEDALSGIPGLFQQLSVLIGPCHAVRVVHYQDRGSPCCGTESRWDRPLKRRTRKSDHQEDDDQHAEQEEEKLTQSDLADPRLLKFLEKCESTELHRPQAPERQQMEHQRNGRREKAKKEKGLEKHHEG